MEERRRETIAVIIPYYQRAPGILRRAVDSILIQAAPADLSIDIVIIDDGSPLPAEADLDGLSLATPFRVHIHRQENGGVAAARNAGLQRAEALKADMVAFLDSDDRWLGTHLARGVEALRSGTDLYFCDHSRDGHHTSVFQEFGFPGPALTIGPSGPNRAISPSDLFHAFLKNAVVHMSTLVVRANRLRGITFDRDLKIAGEDRLFILRAILASGSAVFAQEIGVVCGSGVNIYYSKLGWDDRGAMERELAEVVGNIALLNALELEGDDRALTERRIDGGMTQFAFLTCRWLVKMRSAPWNAEIMASTRKCDQFTQRFARGLLAVPGRARRSAPTAP